MNTERFTLQTICAAAMALALTGVALAEETIQSNPSTAPVMAAPPSSIQAVPAAAPPSTVQAVPATEAQPAPAEAAAPVAPAAEPAASGAAGQEGTPSEAENKEQAVTGYDSTSRYTYERDRFRERMEAQREARQQAMEQYRSARRWWNNPYSEQRRQWNKARSEWYQKQAEQRREYFEQHRPAYSYEYERPGYDYEYAYGPGYYYGRSDTTPGRWNGTPYGGWGPWY